MKPLKQCDILEKVSCSEPHNIFHHGTVLSHQHPNVPGYTLVGWEEGYQPGYAWDRSYSRDFTHLMPKGIEWAYWFFSDTMVEKEGNTILVSAPVSSGGMSCSGCGDFNQYGQPNTPDNRFICYSCKSSGRK